MIADTEIVQPDACADMSVDSFDDFPLCLAARNIRLVAHADQQKAGILEETASLNGPVDEPYFSQAVRRKGLPSTDNGLVEHAVPVEKYGPLVPYRTDSHFVLLA